MAQLCPDVEALDMESEGWAAVVPRGLNQGFAGQDSPVTSATRLAASTPALQARDGIGRKRAARHLVAYELTAPLGIHRRFPGSGTRQLWKAEVPRADLDARAASFAWSWAEPL